MREHRRKLRFRLATPMQPGPIAVLDVFADTHDELVSLLSQLTGRSIEEYNVQKDYSSGGCGVWVCDLDGIDRGVVSMLNPNFAQIMPHGGLRVIQRLQSRLVELGVEPIRKPDTPRLAYPEAESDVEALMLEALAAATSPLATDLLLKQPALWAGFDPDDADAVTSMRLAARKLSRLLTPATVVIAGKPNVGKSTLTNTLVGRESSITFDEAGTTRDFVGSLLDLGGLVVRWIDTPGIRDCADEIEDAAMQIAHQVMAQADLIIEAIETDDMTDGAQTPLLRDRLPDMQIMLKSDLMKHVGEMKDVLRVSAFTGDGIIELVSSIRDCLVPSELLDSVDPWLFDERLLGSSI